jgi:hypothetical protein
VGSEDFYREMTSFSKFSGVVNDAHFHTVPSDWKVVITDVKGSTKAIEAGRYKDVNTVGAAAIACVQNVMGNIDLPFVFGGDGATFLVPSSHFDAVKEELVALQHLSQETFGLPLRLGVVDVAELESEDIRIKVAKFELVAGKAVAIFRGGGLTAAEEKVKGQPDKYCISDAATKKADLKGLSCRWQPIPNRHGKILSLLVVARSKTSDKAYSDVLDRLDNLYEGKMESANPVNIDSMRYRSISQCLKDERRYHTSRFSLRYIMRFIEIVIAVMIFKFKIPAIFFNAKKYAASMATHSDYRKFDDALRMIIDCSATQAEEFQKTLEKMYQEETIFYGVHESETSLMTCYVNGLDEGQHIHFVDGGDGGYAMAAKQLKQQMKDEAAAQPTG